MSFGFEWGPMVVTRLASYAPRKGATAHILGIKTARADIEVYVSRTGKVRVWKDGTEMVTSSGSSTSSERPGRSA